jgi:hypothetical protein
MSSVGRRLRRAVWVGFVGAALTGLLATGAAAAVPVGHGSDRATPVARTDVHIRDVAADTGVQPHSLDPLWASPDIKVCPTAVECAVSQKRCCFATAAPVCTTWVHWTRRPSWRAGTGSGYAGRSSAGTRPPRERAPNTPPRRSTVNSSTRYGGRWPTVRW